MTAALSKSLRREIISIWLPYLAINRWQRQAGPDADSFAAVLTSDSAHGPRITAVNPAAMQAGAQIGQRLADARARYPALKNYPDDIIGDQKALAALALWTQRWGPWSMADRPDAIILDVSGASHLRGGPVAILKEIEASFKKRGFQVRPAMAATAGAAWGLSHYGAPRTIAGLDSPLTSLAPLSVAALRLEPKTLLLLRRLGLKTIEDLCRVPRKNLARRFRDSRNPAANPLIRLDQLLGKVPEPMIPLRRDNPPRVSRQLLEPILHRSLLDQIMRDLAGDMVAELEAQRLGTRRLELRAYRIDGDVIIRMLELAQATRDSEHIMRLFAAKLDDVDAGFGIDQVDMWSTWSEPLALEQTSLQSGTPKKGTSLPQLLDRLASRLGPEAVRRPVPVGSHIPERSFTYIAANDPVKPSQSELRFYERPIKLLDRAEQIAVIYATPEGVPRRFQWRGKLHDIARSEGPERIAPEWWKEKSTVRLRDYYRIEDQTGARYWIYRNGVIGDGRGGPPDWYIHGMFA